MDLPFLNESQLRQLLDLDDGKTTLLCEMAALFKAETPQRLSAIQEGIESSDATAIADAAHALKGASGLMGAQAVFDLARDLEMKAKTGTLPSRSEMMELLSGLSDAVSDAQVGIDNFLLKARG